MTQPSQRQESGPPRAYDVFISFKHTDSQGSVTLDSRLAEEVFRALEARGLRVFLSSISLERLGVASYQQAIREALDASAVLVAVGTSRENLESGWVAHEWSGFLNDILSGIKHGRVFAYIDVMRLADLPFSLRQQQTFQHGAGSLDQLGNFVVNALDRQSPPTQPTPQIRPTLQTQPTPRNVSIAVGVEGGRLHGLSLAPYLAGQIPGTAIGISQLRQRLEIVAPFTQWIRSYARGGMEPIGDVAHSIGLKAAIGMSLQADRAANAREIASGVATARARHADLLVVGSEVLVRGDLTEAELVSYIRQIRQQAPGDIPIAIHETEGALLSHPHAVAAVDIVIASVFPYWEGSAVEDALDRVASSWSRLAESGARQVILETGWPSAGLPVGKAVPSLENATRYFLDFVAWARANQTGYFYFEAFDQKRRPETDSWGLWTTEALPKLDIAQAVRPSIDFTGPHDGEIRGWIRNADPCSCSVAVYVRVENRWWNKPYATHPVTPIDKARRWSARVVTGGVDHLADRVAAFMIPKGVTAPVCMGTVQLDPALFGVALARQEKDA
jgi:glucan 1,3-beta-glucosidase